MWHVALKVLGCGLIGAGLVVGVLFVAILVALGAGDKADIPPLCDCGDEDNEDL